jgi:hypothetical protein
VTFMRERFHNPLQRGYVVRDCRLGCFLLSSLLVCVLFPNAVNT